jgi:hypothetical protein
MPGRVWPPYGGGDIAAANGNQGVYIFQYSKNNGFNGKIR